MVLTNRLSRLRVVGVRGARLIVLPSTDAHYHTSWIDSNLHRFLVTFERTLTCSFNHRLVEWGTIATHHIRRPVRTANKLQLDDFRDSAGVCG